MDCSAYPNKPCEILARLGADCASHLSNILGKGSYFSLVWWE